MFHMPLEYYERDRAELISALAGILRQGSLGLLLGSGCSADMNLLCWHDLVNECSKAALKKFSSKKDLLRRRFTHDSPAEDLFSRMETIRGLYADDAAYLQVVGTHLYRKYPKGIAREPSNLLRAIGAITMPSKRGSVKDVVTLNFDCLLEWYLGLHGVVTQIVAGWPALLGDADVTVYHPHGYLPITDAFGPRSEMIVFDSIEVDKQLTKQPAWRNAFKQLLTTRFMLAIGLGGRDYLLRSLLYDAMKEVNLHKGRPLGCWLCTNSVTEETRQQIRKRGFLAVGLNTKEDADQLLFDICRAARADTITSSGSR